ncbi:hypothetical protein AB0I00_07315 [Streptomyces sp. NPDC050803]|uniref:hypothetical protein n=1 Tax=unclassified Streptomyces TaxID=2593676 RepID=UPI003434A9D0
MSIRTEGPFSIGELIVWETGEAHFLLGETLSGDTTDERFQINDENQLIQALDRLGRWVHGEGTTARTEEFLLDLDAGMLDYFREIATVMVERFGISRAEAVARINDNYAGVNIGPYPDLMCHETPEYWARDLRYGPPPPPDSPAWTLRN